MKVLIFALSLLLVAPAAQAAGPGLLDAEYRPLAGKERVNLARTYGGRVLLVVNTASKCGYTPQYEGLEALHKRFEGRGFAVLGFPSNDFAQEKGSNKEIADFCENTFGVKFPMFGKSAVRGADANALFRQLAAETGRAPLWNFHKYLIGRDGKVVAQYASMTRPDDPTLVKALEQQLASR